MRQKVKAPKAPRISEKSIQLEIMTALGYHGWRIKRCPPSIYSAGGWCDLIALKQGLVLFIEVKAADGKQSNDQKAFERDIRDGGGHYILARSYNDVAAAIQRITGSPERRLV